MVHVSDAWKTAIKNKEKQKILLEFPDVTLTNDDIAMAGGLEYTEILNGDIDLNMGKAVMSSVTVRLVNKGQIPESVYSTEFTVKIGVDVGGGVYEYIPLGIFTPERPQKIKSKYVDLQAYDRMNRFEGDASSFLHELNLYDNPKTAGEIFVEICNLCGVGYVSSTFRHYRITLRFDTFRNKEVTFREVLAWIAECGGNSVRISRDGLVEMVSFAEQDYTISKGQQFEAVVAEKITPVIDKLEVYTSYTDILTESGSGSNLYQIIDNPFLYAENDGEVDGVTGDIYGWLYNFPAYYPATVRAEADPAVQCGDIIRFVDDDGTEKILPVFAQTITWNGYAKAVYESTGQPKRSNLPTEQRMLANLKKEFVRKTDLSTTIDSYLSTEEGKAGIIAAVTGEFVTADALKGYAKTTEVSATIEQAITAHDATISLTASSSTTNEEVPVGSYVANGDVTYGFTLTSDGYRTSNNKGIDDSFAYGIFHFSFDEDTEVTFRCVSYGENNYDYGILSIPNMYLSEDNSTDSVHTYHSFKGESSETPQDIKITIPAGSDQFITFKYIKDRSQSSGGDYFKIKALVFKPGTSQTSTITLKSGSTVISSADITFSGIVTFESLETAGATVINGANVTTENLFVETVWATNTTGTHHKIVEYYYGGTNNLYIDIGRSDADVKNYPQSIALNCSVLEMVDTVYGKGFTISSSGFDASNYDFSAKSLRTNQYLYFDISDCAIYTNAAGTKLYFKNSNGTYNIVFE